MEIVEATVRFPFRKRSGLSHMSDYLPVCRLCGGTGFFYGEIWVPWLFWRWSRETWGCHIGWKVMLFRSRGRQDVGGTSLTVVGNKEDWAIPYPAIACSGRHRLPYRGHLRSGDRMQQPGQDGSDRGSAQSPMACNIRLRVLALFF